MRLNSCIFYPGSSSKSQQLLWFKATTNRERAIFSKQPIVKHQPPDSYVKVICNWMAMQIDYANSASGYESHLVQQLHNLAVCEVVSKEGTNRVIELPVRERQLKNGTAH